MRYASPSSDLTHYVNLTEAVRLGYGAYETLRGYIANGRLPAVKVGGRVKVLRTDLDALTVPVVPREEQVSRAAAIAALAPELSDQQVRELAALLGGTS